MRTRVVCITSVLVIALGPLLLSAQENRPSAPASEPPALSPADGIRVIEEQMAKRRPSAEGLEIGKDIGITERGAAETICAAEQLPMTPPDPDKLKACFAAKGVPQ
jgi:hypothetical protein